MKKLLLFLLAFSLLNVSMAQEVFPPDTSKTLKKNGFGIYLIVPRLEFSPEIKLNSLLQQNGYPEIPKLTLRNLGFGAQFKIGNWVISGGLMGGFQTLKNKNERTEIEHSVSTLDALFSYYLKKIDIKNGANTLCMYPFIGFSTNQANLYLTQPSETQPINTLLASPNNALHLKHYTDCVTFGIGADLGSLYDDGSGVVSGSGLVSIKVGYRFSLETLPWYDGAVIWHPLTSPSQLPPATIPDAPRDHFNQFFFQLNLGGMLNWGSKKK